MATFVSDHPLAAGLVRIGERAVVEEWVESDPRSLIEQLTAT
jgi:hypothetical protein